MRETARARGDSEGDIVNATATGLIGVGLPAATVGAASGIATASGDGDEGLSSRKASDEASLTLTDRTRGLPPWRELLSARAI